jgi:hypothetical protein
VTVRGLKRRRSDRGVTGLAIAPPARERAAEEAVRRPFIVAWIRGGCAEDGKLKRRETSFTQIPTSFNTAASSTFQTYNFFSILVGHRTLSSTSS